MPKKLTFEEAKERLADVSEHFELLEYASPKSTILDKRRNKVVKYRLQSLVNSLRKNPDYQPEATKAEVVAARQRTMVDRYGVTHAFHSQELRDKAKSTCRASLGVDNPMQSVAVQQKATETMLARYGATRASGQAAVQAKAVQTNLQKYGVEHHLKLESQQEKQRVTVQERYGVDNPRQVPGASQRAAQTCLHKYGVDNPHKDPGVRAKQLATMKERYGRVYPMQVPSIASRSVATRLAGVNIRRIDGKTISEWATTQGVAATTIYAKTAQFGDDIVSKLSSTKSALEVVVKGWLDEAGVSYTTNKKFLDTSCRPDFVVHDHKVVIECDGVYWHTEKYAPRNYHVDRLRAYESRGYRLLSFRSYEIEKRPDVVKSMIYNALKVHTTRVFARKCAIQDADVAFFAAHHLMGAGKGTCYGLFHPTLGCVAAMQVRRLDKQGLDVARFCILPGYSVPGGFSRLVAHVRKVFSPSRVQTFIDRRYGQGTYLGALGFTKCTEHVSFGWTNGHTVWHRMAHPSNTGYAAGLLKIWDCGQARYELQCTTP